MTAVDLVMRAMSDKQCCLAGPWCGREVHLAVVVSKVMADVLLEVSGCDS